MIAPSMTQIGAIFILVGLEPENLVQDSINSPKCGETQIPPNSLMTRIVGGRGARSGVWPWQIAVLDRKKRLVCGGTLITSEFVLTAAHCVSQQMYIIAGEYHLVDKEDYEQERRVVRAFKHPHYNKDNVDNDIALLKLESPLEFTQYVWPACLPRKDEELQPKTFATILGWGAISYRRTPNGKPQVEREDVLYQADVPIVDFEECKNSYGDDLESHHVICAGFREGGVDSCAGDSGGPLLVKRRDKWYVYGVTSFGDECGKEGKYGIYSQTSAYIDWIRKIVGKHASSK